MNVISAGKGQMLQPPDLNAFREHNRNKPRGLIDKRMTEKEAVEKFIHDGDYIGTELYGTVRCPQSLVNEVIRQGKKELSVAGQGVYELDLILGAGLVKAIDHTYIGMEVYGISNTLRREVESGRVVHCVEWSNAAISWRFKATAMGVPFLPTRSMLGTDTFEYSAAKVVEDPFGGGPLALLPALILDTGMIHVHRADKYGNCQIDGISGFAFEMARASKNLLISTEKIVPTEVIRQQPDRTIIPYYLVDAVIEAPFGAHPGEMCYVYERDEPQIKDWMEASKDPETTRAYLYKYIYDLKDHQAYLDLIGKKRLQELKEMVPGGAR